MKRFKHYLGAFVEVYAYCLLPNHFHFLIKTSELPQDLTGYKNLSGLEDNYHKFLSKQFSNFFNSYAKTYNLHKERKGSLFMRPFKRIKVNDGQYLTQLVYYIHRNPLHHGICKSIDKWKHSSYQSILSDKNTLIKRVELLDWFYGKESFIQYHKQMQNDWITYFIEDDL